MYIWFNNDKFLTKILFIYVNNYFYINISLK